LISLSLRDDFLITNNIIDINKNYAYYNGNYITGGEGMGKKAAVIMPQTRDFLQQMGEQIKLARLRRKLPSALVAERAGISRQTLTAIEKGASTVSIGSYAAALHALNGMDKDLLLVAKDDELGRKLQDIGLLMKKRAPKTYSKD
jgi:Uncharacterized protein conserved in bacteria